MAMALSEAELEECKKLISTLPKGADPPMLLYQNFWVPDHVLPWIVAFQRHFTPLPGDVLLATMPKAGTTWLKALAFAIVHRSRYTSADHPLLTRSPHECVPFVEAIDVSMVPSPRILGTHLGLSQLPASVTSSESNCSIVYLARDPKDVLVSSFHFLRKNQLLSMEFDQYFELFCRGQSPGGPAWDHALEYWRASLETPEKVLFLKYEELIKDPKGKVKVLAQFIGHPFSEEEEKNGVVDEIVDLCSIETLRKTEASNNSISLGERTFSNASFFRNGKTGGWSTDLAPELAERLDTIVAEKLQGSGLTLFEST